MSNAAFNLFAYGTLRRDAGPNEVLNGAAFVGTAAVHGTLYDVDGRYPALMLYGSTRVKGDIWRCPADLLWRLDGYESVDRSLFRRIGVEIGDFACWTYVAGPALARRLTPDRRIPGGDWLEHAGAR